MPYIIPSQRPPADFSSVHFDYDYPNGLDLKPGSELHNFLRDRILERVNESHLMIKNRFDSWNDVDRILTAYIPADEEEEKLKEQDPRKPISIVFPYSYAMLETLLTYLMAAFIQDPIFRYEGVSPEDTVGAMLLELVIKRHCEKSKVALALHTMFRDSLAYGLGIVAPAWEKRVGKRTVKRELTLPGISRSEFSRAEKATEEVVTYEGNVLHNINPYLYLPDPHVAAHDVQSGEFVGWIVRDNLMNMLSEEENSPHVFNVKYLKKLKNCISAYYSDYSERNRKTTNKYEPPAQSPSFNKVDRIYLYINLIPKDWKLSERETPEKWIFSLAGDEVITECRPLDLNHDLYPVAVAAPEFDGYSSAPISRLEILYGLQGVLDFMFNSHVANVRKAINDMIIYDPMLVNSKDMENPKPGKLVRLRRPAWGRGVRDVAIQLKVDDITRNNIADSSYIVQWMQRIAAADDSLMGVLRTGGPERLTGQEFAGTRAGAMTRLERFARIIGIQALQDIGHMFAAHTQQLMEEETFINITGRWREELIRVFGLESDVARMKVTPFDLLIDYDVSVRDGSVPGANFSSAWVEIFKIISSSSELMQEIDSFRVFTFIAQNLGAKNISDFRRPVQPIVAPDEAVERQAAVGNLVPTSVKI